MSFIRKVFYENKRIIFTDSLVDFLAENEEGHQYLPLVGATLKNLTIGEQFLTKAENTGVLIEDSKKGIKSLLDLAFKKVLAAGGLVQTPTGATLMIFRGGKWDLPKGKLEKGEEIEDCAIREVREETGLPKEIELGELITKTYHTYLYSSKKVLKTTYWYQMDVQKEWDLSPQTEEDIAQAVWTKPDQLVRCMDNTWLTIKHVFENAAKLKRQ